MDHFKNRIDYFGFGINPIKNKKMLLIAIFIQLHLKILVMIIIGLRRLLTFF